MAKRARGRYALAGVDLPASRSQRFGLDPVQGGGSFPGRRDGAHNRHTARGCQPPGLFAPKSLAFDASLCVLLRGGEHALAAAMTRRIVAGLAVLLAPALCAGCGGPDFSSPFLPSTTIEKEFMGAAVTWDLNRDGDVTCEEWKAYVADLFREADGNRDGVLAPDEFADLARRDRLFEYLGFKYFDTAGKGKLTLAQIADKPNPAFTILDTSKDCRITPGERAGIDERPPARGKGKRSP